MISCLIKSFIRATMIPVITRSSKINHRLDLLTNFCLKYQKYQKIPNVFFFSYVNKDDI